MSKVFIPSLAGVYAWAIVMQMSDGTRLFVHGSVKRTRSKSIRWYEGDMKGSWKKLYHDGDRCIRVLLSPAR